MFRLVSYSLIGLVLDSLNELVSCLAVRIIPSLRQQIVELYTCSGEWFSFKFCDQFIFVFTINFVLFSHNHLILLFTIFF